MAILPLRVQRILYERLSLYNCVSEDHPHRLQDYGGVVISSGGCFKSLANWFYAEASLFRADFSSLSTPVVMEVTKTPVCFLANGPYLKTTRVYNGSPVYAQVTQHELKTLRTCIQDDGFLQHILQTAPNFSGKELRAGERLLVRNEAQNAWIVQSVSAYQGHTKSDGPCGFFLLEISDDVSIPPRCFSGMNNKFDTQEMTQCSGSIQPAKDVSSAFLMDSIFRFSFGTKRSVVTEHFKSSEFKPQPTRHQQIHTDGRFERDHACMLDENGKVITNGLYADRLFAHSQEELEFFCREKGIDLTEILCKEQVPKTSSTKQAIIRVIDAWLDEQAATPFPVRAPTTTMHSTTSSFTFT